MRHFLYVFVLLWALLPQLATAHASLQSSTPERGATLSAAPAAIELVFNEPVAVSKAVLHAPNGDTTTLTTDSQNTDKPRLQLPQDNEEGTYLLSWRVISADGHPVGGTLDYAVGAASSNPAQAASSSHVMRDALIWLARWLGYLTLFASIGAVFFRTIITADRHTWAKPLMAVGVVLLGVNLGLQGLDMTDASWSALTRAEPWLAALSSSYSHTLGLMLLAFIFAYAALQARQLVRLRILATLALLATGAALTASGHASTAPPRWMAHPLVSIHVIFVIIWIGSLIPLARSLNPRFASDTGALGLRSFSAWITPAVLILALSGAGLAYLQLQSWNDFWQTAYGRVLTLKLILVGFLLLVAAFNRWHLTRPALQHQPGAARALRRAIGIEVIFVIVILAVVSSWRLTPPPRSFITPPAPTMAFHLEDDAISANVERMADGQTWRMTLMTNDKQPFTAQAVTLHLANPALEIDTIDAEATPLADNRWQAHMPRLPQSDDWQASLDVLIDDFTQTTLRAGKTKADSAMSHTHHDDAAHTHEHAHEHADAPDTHDAHADHAHSDAAMTAEALQDLPTADAVAVQGCWVRLMPGDLPSGGYFTLENQGEKGLELTQAATPAFAETMLHQTADGSMRHVDAITIAAGDTLVFAPGSYHLMLENAQDTLQPGDTIAMTFGFADQTRASTTCEIKPANTVD